jgi:Tol biopolymer transport system component
VRNNAPLDEKALFVVNVDGTGLQQITGWGAAGCCTASWSPDGSTILFDAHDRLYLIRPDGTDLRRIELAVEGGYSAYEPAWSPDGTRLVFSLFQPPESDSLFIVRPDGTDLLQLTADDGQQEGQPDWGSYLP